VSLFLFDRSASSVLPLSLEQIDSALRSTAHGGLDVPKEVDGMCTLHWIGHVMATHCSDGQSKRQVRFVTVGSDIYCSLACDER
jgi:hypothetical protein